MNGASPSGLLIATHDLCWQHDPGPGHPERPQRLTAVRHGIELSGVADGVTWVEAPEAPMAAVNVVLGLIAAFVAWQRFGPNAF